MSMVANMVSSSTAAGTPAHLADEEFLTRLQQKACYGGEQELYQTILATLAGLADSIRERGLTPCPASYLAHASQLLKEESSGDRSWSVLKCLLHIVKLTLAEVTVGMQASVAPELSRALFALADAVKCSLTAGSSGENGHNILGNADHNVDMEINNSQQPPEQTLQRKQFQEEASTILKLIFDILAVLITCSTQGTQKEALHFCWQYTLGMSSCSGTATTSMNDNVESSCVDTQYSTLYSAQVAKKAQQVFLTKLQTAASGSASALLVMRVRQTVRKVLQDYLTCSMNTNNTASSTGKRLSQDDDMNSSTASSNPEQVAKNLVMFVTRCLPHVHEVKHLRELAQYMFDLALQIPGSALPAQIYNTFFRALLKDCYKELVVPNTGTNVEMNMIPEDGQQGRQSGTTSCAPIQPLPRRELLNFLLQKFRQVKPAPEFTNNSEQVVAVVKALTWLQLCCFEEYSASSSPCNGKMQGTTSTSSPDLFHDDVLAPFKQLVADYSTEDETIMRCLFDIVAAVPNLKIWCLLASFLTTKLRGGDVEVVDTVSKQGLFAGSKSAASSSASSGSTTSGGGPSTAPIIRAPELLLTSELFAVLAKLMAEGVIATSDFTEQESKLVLNLLRAIANLYDTISEPQFRQLADEFHDCLRNIATAVGPEKLLEVLPLRLLEANILAPDYARKSRGFLLTVLEDFATPMVPASLDFFRTQLLPLADELESRAVKAESQNKQLLAKECKLLSKKLWSLAPGFFKSCHDFSDTFLKSGGALAKRVCMTLTKRPDLRDSCSKAVFNICSVSSSSSSSCGASDERSSSATVIKNTTSMTGRSEQVRARDQQTLSKLAPKIIPEMFQCFLQIHKELSYDASARSRSSALLGQAIQAYSGVLRPDSVATLFGQAAERMLKTNQELANCYAELSGSSSNRSTSDNNNIFNPQQAANTTTTAQLLQKRTLLENELAYVCELCALLVPNLPTDKLEVALKAFETTMGLESGRRAAGSVQRACYKGVKCVFEHRMVEEVSENMLDKYWSILNSSRLATEEGAFKSRLKAILSFLKMIFQEEEEDEDDFSTAEDSSDESHEEDGSKKAGLEDHSTAKSSAKKVIFVSPEVQKNFLQVQLNGDSKQSFLISELLSYTVGKNKQVRILSEEALFKIYRACLQNDLGMPLIGALGADLTSSDVATRAQSVEALAKLLYEHAEDMEDDILEQICEVVFILLRDKDKQVFKSVLKFAKVMTYVAPVSVLKRRTIFYQDGKNPVAALTSSFLHDIYSNPNSESCNLLKRRIVEKLLKRLCYMSAEEDLDEEDEDEEVDLETFRKSFPHKHLPQLDYVLKGLEKRARKNLQAREEEKTEQVKKSYLQFFKDDDEAADATTNDKAGRNMTKSSSSSGKKRRQRGGEIDDEDDVDMMGEDAPDAVSSLLDKWENQGDNDGFESGNRKRARRLHKETASATDCTKTSIFSAGKDSIFRKNCQLPSFTQDGVLDLSDLRSLAHNLFTTTASASSSGAAGAGAAKPGSALGRKKGDSSTADSSKNDDRGVSFRPDGKMLVAEEPSDSDGEDDGGAGHKKDTPKKGLAVLKAQREKRLLKKLVQKRDKKQHTVRGVTHYAPTKGKARGDAKPRGAQHEPYAYVALNPRLMKEKFKQKSVSTFKAVTGKAPERGNKAKKLQVKKKGNKKSRKSGKKNKK
ncbi:unnamed protein product [Amoebophrya sp. A120]|nr:unnamed protein product [Amoebophrya sp. A120]|eukprot:GSA120T00008380001.1